MLIVMNFFVPFRGLPGAVFRAGAAVLAVVLLGACAANPPPGSLPAPEAPNAEEDVAVPPAGGPRWTVQLHAGEDSVVAEEVASRARERFDDPVAVLDHSGEYHVEIGEFAHEADARAFLGVARERGFPDASIHRLQDRPETPTTAP